MIIKIPDYTYFHIKKYKEDALDRSIILEAIREGKDSTQAGNIYT